MALQDLDGADDKPDARQRGSHRRETVRIPSTRMLLGACLMDAPFTFGGLNEDV